MKGRVILKRTARRQRAPEHKNRTGSAVRQTAFIKDNPMQDRIEWGKTASPYPARLQKDGLCDGASDENGDFSRPDPGASGSAKPPRAARNALPFGQTQALTPPSSPKTPAASPPAQSGFTPAISGTRALKPPYPSGLAAGLQATADTLGTEHDPDNQASSRLFQAGQHKAVASSLEEEHDFANAPSVRLMQAARHDVPEKTFDMAFNPDRQPGALLWRQMRESASPVSGMEAVARVNSELSRLHQWEQEKGPDYARPFFKSLRQSFLNGMRPNHEATVFERASERPDRFARTPPLDKAQSDARYLADWEKRLEDTYQKERQDFSYPDKTAQQIHEMKEKMSALSGSVVEPAILIAVSRRLPGSTIYWTAHEWNRLAGQIHRQVLDKTGNDLLAQSIAAGAIAAMTERFVPGGLFPSRYAPNFGEIAATVSSVLDGLLAGYVGEEVAEWEAKKLIDDSPNQQ